MVPVLETDLGLGFAFAPGIAASLIVTDNHCQVYSIGVGTFGSCLSAGSAEVGNCCPVPISVVACPCSIAFLETNTINRLHRKQTKNNYLTLLWRRFLSHKNQSIDLQNKSMDWCLYDTDFRYERVKT